MARAGVDPMVRYGVLAALGWFGWNWAKGQPMTSPARQTVDQIRATVQSNLHAAQTGTPPLPSRTSGGAPIPPADKPIGKGPPPPGEAGSDQWRNLGLTDLGGFPLERLGERLRQRADLGGTNEYHPGDLVISPNDGRQWQWVGGLVLEATDGTAEVTRLDYYVEALPANG